MLCSLYNTVESNASAFWIGMPTKASTKMAPIPTKIVFLLVGFISDHLMGKNAYTWDGKLRMNTIPFWIIFSKNCVNLESKIRQKYPLLGVKIRTNFRYHMYLKNTYDYLFLKIPFLV